MALPAPFCARMGAERHRKRHRPPKRLKCARALSPPLAPRRTRRLAAPQLGPKFVPPPAPMALSFPMPPWLDENEEENNGEDVVFIRFFSPTARPIRAWAWERWLADWWPSMQRWAWLGRRHNWRVGSKAYNIRQAERHCYAGC